MQRLCNLCWTQWVWKNINLVL